LLVHSPVPVNYRVVEISFLPYLYIFKIVSQK
jgi:hypothetical protein